MKLIYNVQDKPKLSQTLIFAFQQMIAIMAATLLVPMIMTGYGLPADPAAALFGAGLGTIVYILFTKRRSQYSWEAPLPSSAPMRLPSARTTATGVF